jgi:predicted metal-dependent RNase
LAETKAISIPEKNAERRIQANTQISSIDQFSGFSDSSSDLILCRLLME